MVAAILAGCAAVLLTVILIAFALTRTNGAGLEHALADVRFVAGIAIKMAGLPILALASVFGIVAHHVLHARGRDSQLRWYAAAGALFGGLVLLALLWTEGPIELGPTAALMAVGAFLGTVNALAFGAVIRRGRHPAAVAPPSDSG
jgi:hypothetical protein